MTERKPNLDEQGPEFDQLAGPGGDAAPTGDVEVPASGDRSITGTRKTMSRKAMAREQRRMGELESDEEMLRQELKQLRPRTRAECEHGARPCLFLSCKHHLYIDVNPRSGSIKYNFPDQELWELEFTCALDAAEQGGRTLEEVGVMMNLTRERVRQVESSGLSKLREVSQDLDPY